MNNNQYCSQVVFDTKTPIIFINLEWCGGRVCTEVSTKDGECKCATCQMAGVKLVFKYNATFRAKFVHHFSPLKLMGLKMGTGVVRHV